MRSDHEIVRGHAVQVQIFEVRGKQVILDSELAAAYGVTTSALNQTVHRNMDRFPDDFSFELTESEWEGLKSQFVISNSRGGRRYLPRVYTEHGITMLAALLRSDEAVQLSIRIVREFVRLRRESTSYAELAQRIDRLEGISDKRYREVLAVLQQLLTEPPADSPRTIGFRREDT